MSASEQEMVNYLQDAGALNRIEWGGRAGHAEGRGEAEETDPERKELNKLSASPCSAAQTRTLAPPRRSTAQRAACSAAQA